METLHFNSEWFNRDLGFIFRPNSDDEIILEELVEKDIYRIEEWAELLGRYKENILLDVGAHIGVFTRIWLNQMPNSRVICYEPIIENFDLLKANTQQYQIEVHNAAVARENGNGVLNLSNPDYTGRWKLSNSPTNNFLYEQKSVMKSINEVIENIGSDDINIKMDVEGAEYELIEALSKENWSRINMLIIEWHEDPVPTSFFNKLGFVLLFHPKNQQRHAVYLRPQTDLQWILDYSMISQRILTDQFEETFKKLSHESRFNFRNLFRRLNSRLRSLTRFSL